MSARNFDIKKPKKYANVRVEHTVDTHGRTVIVHVTLHDTVVVRYSVVTGQVTLDTGGWYTVTTKTAINTALRQLPGFEDYAVYQKEHIWYVNGQQFSDGMKLDPKQVKAG